jgi:nitrate/TMAO reductase-like tetraheme cytochrome c subunit
MSLPEVREKTCQNCADFNEYKFATERKPCEKHSRIVREGFCADCKLKVVSLRIKESSEGST